MHYIIEHESHTVKFRPGYPETDFKNWWRNQQPCWRDGCSSVSVKVKSTENLTDARLKRYWAKERKNPDAFLECPDKYECKAVLIGIVGWCSERKVRKVVNHHIQEVVERKNYKTRPSKGLKGSTIYAIGKYVCSYDGRDYDPWEHGGERISDEPCYDD